MTVKWEFTWEFQKDANAYHISKSYFVHSVSLHKTELLREAVVGLKSNFSKGRGRRGKIICFVKTK